ncbi:MAG: hypothetical protein ACI30K_08535 [Muribaculaceae bacterium]
MLPSRQNDYTGVTRCEGLRLNAEGRYEVAAMPPGAMADYGQPRCVVAHAEGGHSIVASRGAVLTFAGGAAAQHFTLGAAGVPMVVAAGYDVIAGDTMGERYLFSRDAEGAWHMRLFDAALPVVEMQTTDAGALSCHVDERQLSQTYSSGLRLAHGDRLALSGDLCDAYRGIDAAARAAGVLWLPVVAYYRLYDSAGRLLLSSAPLLLMHPDGVGAVATDVVLTSADRRTVDAYDYTARAYKLALRLAADDEAARRVARLDLMVSPALHVSDLGDAGTCSLLSGLDDSFARLSLPAATLGVSARAPQSSRRCAAAVTERAAALCRCVYSLSKPFSAESERQITVEFAAAGDVSADIAAVKRAVATAVAPCSALAALVAQPNIVSAATSTAVGDTLVMASLMVRRFRGYGPAAYAVGYADRSWYGYTEVTFADGSTRVYEASGASRAPIRFAPVLWHPSPEAVALTITVRVSGERTRSITAPLHRDATGRGALWVADGAAPFELTESGDAYSVPIETDSVLTMPQMVAVASVSDPSAVTATAEVPAGCLHAIVAAAHQQSSWDFGRIRCFVGGDSGIYSMSVSIDRSRIGISRIDARGVASQQAMTPTDEGVAAIAGGDIVMLSASRSATVRSNCRGVALAWRATHRELWCIAAAGDADIACYDYGRRRYTISDAAIVAVLSDGCYALAETAAGIVNLNDEGDGHDGEQSVAVELRCVERSAKRQRIRRVALDARCTAIDGVVTVSHAAGSRGLDDGGIVAQRHIAGAVRSPLAFAVLTRDRTDVAVAISGRVSRDFVMLKPELCYE